MRLALLRTRLPFGRSLVLVPHRHGCSPSMVALAAHLERQTNGRSFFARSSVVSLAAQEYLVTVWELMRLEMQLARKVPSKDWPARNSSVLPIKLTYSYATAWAFALCLSTCWVSACCASNR